MSDPTNLIIFVLIVGLRFTIPLFIPRFPLPAIILALVLDGIDGGIFERFTTLPMDEYQSYDKALDIYYLTIAYLSTMRNWSNPFAIKVAAYLLYYRLVGVMLFEFTGARWLLFVFPNTFEYFFILYEAAHLRWNLERVSRRVIIGAAAAIWIVIKLPQEYWIHIAQRDVTDTLAEYPVLIPILAVAIAAIIGVIYWVMNYKLDPAEKVWWKSFEYPLSGEDIKAALIRYRSSPVADQGLLEKVILIAILSLNYSQILPGVKLTPVQLVVGISTIVVLNAATSEFFARLGMGKLNAIVSGVRHFFAVLIINFILAEAVIFMLPGSESWPRISNLLFFFFLVSLLVTLFDRFRAVGMVRHGREQAPSAQ